MKIARRSSYIKSSLDFESSNATKKVNTTKTLVVANIRKFETLEVTITGANRDILGEISSKSIVIEVIFSTIDTSISFATRSA